MTLIHGSPSTYRLGFHYTGEWVAFFHQIIHAFFPDFGPILGGASPHLSTSKDGMPTGISV